MAGGALPKVRRGNGERKAKKGRKAGQFFWGVSALPGVQRNEESVATGLVHLLVLRCGNK